MKIILLVVHVGLLLLTSTINKVKLPVNVVLNIRYKLACGINELVKLKVDAPVPNTFIKVIGVDKVAITPLLPVNVFITYVDVEAGTSLYAIVCVDPFGKTNESVSVNVFNVKFVLVMLASDIYYIIYKYKI
jgi:hypothetical protein